MGANGKKSTPNNKGNNNKANTNNKNNNKKNGKKNNQQQKQKNQQQQTHPDEIILFDTTEPCHVCDVDNPKMGCKEHTKLQRMACDVLYSHLSDLMDTHPHLVDSNWYLSKFQAILNVIHYNWLHDLFCHLIYENHQLPNQRPTLGFMKAQIANFLNQKFEQHDEKLYDDQTSPAFGLPEREKLPLSITKPDGTVIKRLFMPCHLCPSHPPVTIPIDKKDDDSADIVQQADAAINNIGAWYCSKHDDIDVFSKIALQTLIHCLKCEANVVNTFYLALGLCPPPDVTKHLTTRPSVIYNMIQDVQNGKIRQAVLNHLKHCFTPLDDNDESPEGIELYELVNTYFTIQFETTIGPQSTEYNIKVPCHNNNTITKQNNHGMNTQRNNNNRNRLTREQQLIMETVNAVMAAGDCDPMDKLEMMVSMLSRGLRRNNPYQWSDDDDEYDENDLSNYDMEYQLGFYSDDDDEKWMMMDRLARSEEDEEEW